MLEADRTEFVKLLTGVMDVYGTKATTASLSIWWGSLARYPMDAVRGALSSHLQDAMSGKFAPKPADLIGRMQATDGRPGPEEAWSMIPRDEDSSVVWTEEMAQAFGVALPLLKERDQVAARMAFIERYRALAQQARERGESVRWMPSLGHDPSLREAALMEAAEKGRLTAQHVASLLPYRDGPPARLLALMQNARMLENTKEPEPING